MNDDKLEEISQKLDILIRLTAMNSLVGKNLAEQIESLTSVGFTQSEVAKILNKPLNTITGTMSRLRKRKSGKPSDE